jgi:GNAT superfamily N-acetyltransferase
VAGPLERTQAALVLGEYRGWLDMTLQLDADHVRAATRYEYDSLERFYSAPDGELLLATVDGEPAGVVGLRRIDCECAQARRLYVRPWARGHGLGNRLMLALLDLARDRGYRTVALLTRPREMPQAQRIYRGAGFRPSPIARLRGRDGTVCMEVDLADATAPRRLAA